MSVFHAAESEETEVSTIVAGEEVRIRFAKSDVSVSDEGLDAVLTAVADDPRTPVRRGHKPRASGRARHVTAPADPEE